MPPFLGGGAQRLDRLEIRSRLDHGRQRFAQEDIPVAALAQHAAELAQLVLEPRRGVGLDEALEQHQQRTQAADADAHLVDALDLVAAQGRGLVG
jgi:hypothetical protein